MVRQSSYRYRQSSEMISPGVLVLLLALVKSASGQPLLDIDDSLFGGLPSLVNNFPASQIITGNTCGQSGRNPYGRINLHESVNPSVFRDLTSLEIQGLTIFLYSRPELGLVRPEHASVKSNYIFLSELLIPPKQLVLGHLDRGMQQPVREARVILYRGAVERPDFIEIIVGPLPHPNYLRPAALPVKPVPAYLGPPSHLHDRTRSAKLKEYVDLVAGNMLQELYGGRMTHCGKRCIAFGFRTHVASVLSGKRIRLAWYWMQQFVEFNVLHPIDFSLLIEKYGEMFKIHRVYLNGRLFDTLPETVHYYYSHRYNFTRVPFPTENSDLFSTLHQRGQPHFRVPLRNPTQVSPDGKRYNIIDRHVSYTFWDFDVSMGAVNGPQLFDIRFKKERIAYELSLQDVVALYSGAKPFAQLDLFDSYIFLGTLSNYLIPGVDCPSDATFLSAIFKLEISDQPILNKNAMCIFELNTGLPLRRHHAFSKEYGSYYEGMETTILVVRTIMTVSNYDYFIDYRFYANGAIEVKAIATGYITGTSYHPGEEKYGYRLHDNLLGPLHHHLFHFKVDLDIKGTKNRLRTSEIEIDTIPNTSKISINARNLIYQNKIIHKFHPTEQIASHQANTDNFKYITITNEFSKDKYGNSAGYRINNRQPSHLVRPLGVRKEAGLSWARYKVAITKQKDNEHRSSSMYAYLDDEDPVVNFQNFLADDEWVIDEDIVAWVTVGLQHIPHTEDLPVTHTPGMDSTFILTPFNYFKEDPAMASTNAIRLERVDGSMSIRVQRYSVSSEVDCTPAPAALEQLLQRDTCDIFSCS